MNNFEKQFKIFVIFQVISIQQRILSQQPDFMKLSNQQLQTICLQVQLQVLQAFKTRFKMFVASLEHRIW